MTRAKDVSDQVVSFNAGDENEWSDLGDDVIGVAEWLRTNGPANTAQFAGQVTTTYT